MSRNSEIPELSPYLINIGKSFLETFKDKPSVQNSDKGV